jgi:hypothetical protein
VRGLHHQLRISDWTDKQVVFLVPWIDSVGLRRERSYREVGRTEASRLFRRRFMGGERGPEMGKLRGFVNEGLNHLGQLHTMDDSAVIGIVERAIERGEVVALVEDRPASGKSQDEANERRSLWRSLEVATHGRLAHEGRQYRLAIDVDLPGIENRNLFAVVPHDEALRVLMGLAGQVLPPVAALLKKVMDDLSPDWQPPLPPHGLVLLRREEERRRVASSAASIVSPSQLRAMQKSGWIAIEVVDDFGLPVNARIRLELPDGSLVEGNTNDEGVWERQNIEQGKCKVALPEVDEAAWKLA